jgi:hypothetical protein
MTLTFSGDLNTVETVYAALNSASPAQEEIRTLASGATTITVPTGGATVVAVTIIPPAGNTLLITLKGVAGDTGVPLHKTDPTTIALDSTAATFVLNAANTITGVRLRWN